MGDEKASRHRINKALNIAYQYGQIEGSDHRG